MVKVGFEQVEIHVTLEQKLPPMSPTAAAAPTRVLNGRWTEAALEFYEGALLRVGAKTQSSSYYLSCRRVIKLLFRGGFFSLNVVLRFPSGNSWTPPPDFKSPQLARVSVFDKCSWQQQISRVELENIPRNFGSILTRCNLPRFVNTTSRSRIPSRKDGRPALGSLCQGSCRISRVEPPKETFV